MSERVVATGLVAGALAAAWLRFDAQAVILGWLVIVSCIAGALASWILQARRLPSVQLPAIVEELGQREELTSEEEGRFADALRAWHRDRQDTAFREIARRGPGPLITRRAVLYFLWLSLVILTVVPPAAVPATFLPGLARFIVVALTTAVIAVAVAVPLGIRDWRRARHAVGD